MASSEISYGDGLHCGCSLQEVEKKAAVHAEISYDDGLHCGCSLQEVETKAAVHVVQESLVKPLKPTKRHVMYMSVVDQLLRKAAPSRTILFYRTTQDAAIAMEALRLAISAVLVPFYPMAGRLVLDPQDHSRLAIDCNDHGVQLLLARCDLPFAELERGNFRMQPQLFRQLVPMDDRQHSDALDDPFASFQVTSFKEGLVVGIAVLHSIADGHSMWSFIKAISQACRGEPLSIHPLHARILLKPEVFLMGTIFPDVDLEVLTRSNDAPYNGCEEKVRDSNPNPELLHQKVIHFSQGMLETLKKACLASTFKEVTTKPNFYISTYQALGAYLWKRLTMAQNLPDDIGVDLRIAADVRSRVVPQLTSTFFGNAVVGIPTPSTVRELLKEGLGDTAARLQRSIHQGDDTYVKKALIAREKKDLTKLLLSKVKVVVLRNGSGFPIFEGGNFGWGEPEAVRPPWEHREGEFTWYPGKKGKSIDVIVSLSDATYARFFSSDLYPNDPLKQYFFPTSNY